MPRLTIILTTLLAMSFATESVLAAPPTSALQQKKASKKKSKRKNRKSRPFRWVNSPKLDGLTGVKHATFLSPSMSVKVGYCIYLPPGYEAGDGKLSRYPVVYYLHGGRPGSESKSVSLARYVHRAVVNKTIPPTIYVFVNGGPVSHYNMPGRKNAQGEDVFVKELIPHIDKTYRTIADRTGRALEGFSQGGRGTARIMFKHPNLFCSAAPGGGGHATEKRISENEGRESENLKFAPGDNTWDLARRYAKSPNPSFRILVFVGTKGFNYENNLAWMKHLESLQIPFERLIVKDAPHSARIIYEKRGDEIMKFHADNFRRANQRTK